MKERIATDEVRSKNIFDTTSTKVFNALTSEAKSYSEINGLNSLNDTIPDTLKLNIIKNVEKRTSIKMNEENFADIWRKISQIEILNHKLRQLCDCQTIFAFYKTGNLDLIKVSHSTWYS